jgi:hypothetical protein
MKVQVSHRLDSDLLAWATEYGEQRGKSRAVIIEEALKVFRDLCAGGVADLPDDAISPEQEAEETRQAALLAEETRRRRAVRPVVASPLAGRQARLNKEMGW